MKNVFSKSIGKSLSALMVMATLAVPAVYTADAHALTAEERQARQDAKTRIPEPKVGKKVNEAFELYSQELVDEALQVLLEARASKEYDKAFLNKFIGNLYATVDGKATVAIEYLEKAVAPDVLNYKEQAEVLKILAQLYMMEKQFDKAIKGYEDWMAFTGEQESKIYVRIANAYYELKQLDKILEPADKAIALQEEPDATPHVLKLASYYERKMYPETVMMGETLVKLFPEEKRNWVQLGMFYVLVEDYKKGLSTMEMAYKQGYLEKASEFRTLAQMYSQNEVPIRAAQIMDKYLKLGVIEKTEQNLRNVANYYLAAKQMNEASKYFGEVAEMTGKARYYKRQGEMLFAAEKYGQAAVALTKALEKDVERKGSVNMTLMQAYFYQGKFKSAYAALNEANKYPRAKSQVRAWRQYLKDKAKHKGVIL